MTDDASGLLALARRVDALERRDLARRLSRRDRDVLARLLPAIGGLCGSAPWLVREMFDDPGVRLVRGDLSAKALGKLLARAAGLAVDGLVIERVGVEDGAILWAVGAVAG